MLKLKVESLAYYTKEYRELISAMKTGSSKTLIAWADTTIVNAFANYHSNLWSLETFTDSCLTDDDLKIALVKKFENSTSFKDKIRRAYYSRKCPYCWYKSLEENIPVEHFLPKSKFQEYSLLSLNLYLCCSDCNRLKWDHWENDARSTLNPYIDDLYEKDFLRIQINLDNSKIVVSVGINEDCWLSSDETSLLKRHFNKFKLTDRIEKHANTDIWKIVEDISRSKMMNDLDHIDINTHLKILYRQYKVSTWNNAFLTVLYKYFIENPEVLESLLELNESTKT